MLGERERESLLIPAERDDVERFVDLLFPRRRLKIFRRKTKYRIPVESTLSSPGSAGIRRVDSDYFEDEAHLYFTETYDSGPSTVEIAISYTFRTLRSLIEREELFTKVNGVLVPSQPQIAFISNAAPGIIPGHVSRPEILTLMGTIRADLQRRVDNI